MSAELDRCDCAPLVLDDGSRIHLLDCSAYPWCPHEVGAASCLAPCGCPCEPCRALDAAQ